MSVGIAQLGDYASSSECIAPVPMWLLMGLCTLLMWACIWIAIDARAKLGRPLVARPVLFALAAALQAYALSELCMDAVFFKLYPVYNLLGYIMYAVPFVLGAVIFKKPKIWFIVLEVVFAFYSIMQYYITLFRGSPIKFTDLSNLRSAIDIKSEYTFTISFTVVVAVMQTAAIIFLTVITKLETDSKKPRLAALGGCGAAAVMFFTFTGFTYDYGIRNRVILLNFSGPEDTRTSRSVGSLLMFYYDGVYNHVREPEGYSTESAEELTEKYAAAANTKKSPIVIGILNESFADYTHIAPLTTNKDFLANWHKLKDEAVTGYVTVSPYGGYTCNSEYEFLTGNTMHFLPLGSAVYTNYLDSKQDSIVSAFNDMGFETVSFTPCSRVLWNIGEAYDHLGFKKKYFSDNINLLDPLKYNDEPADKALYKRLCQIIDKRDKSKGLFVWVTTMQNHAPYNMDIPGGVELTSHDNIFAERYLNSISLADEALGGLIDHFRDYGEEVTVVMFGDHYPHIEGWADELYGRDLADLGPEEYSLVHQTPFVIWNNRSRTSRTIDAISLNYLSDEVFRVAGLPLTPVQQELEHIREQLPIISSFGSMTADGSWHRTGDDLGGSSYNDILNEYASLQYYRMFDEDRKYLNSSK